MPRRRYRYWSMRAELTLQNTAILAADIDPDDGQAAYLALYEPTAIFNPSDVRCRDLKGFRVKRLWPRPRNEIATASAGRVGKRAITDQEMVSQTPGCASGE